MYSQFPMSIIFINKIKAVLENFQHSVASFFYPQKNIAMNTLPLLDKSTIRTLNHHKVSCAIRSQYLIVEAEPAEHLQAMIAQRAA